MVSIICSDILLFILLLIKFDLALLLPFLVVFIIIFMNKILSNIVSYLKIIIRNFNSLLNDLISTNLALMILKFYNILCGTNTSLNLVFIRRNLIIMLLVNGNGFLCFLIVFINEFG